MVGSGACPFCAIVHGFTEGRSPLVLFKNEEVVAFQDRDPAALRHFLVIPVRHVRDVNALQKGEADYALVANMLKIGESLLHNDAPQASSYSYGFHRPPFNSVNHLHLHCIALPYRSWWRAAKYVSLGRWGCYLSAERVLETLRHTAIA